MPVMLPGDGIGAGTSTQLRATVELANKQPLQRAARMLTDFPVANRIEGKFKFFIIYVYGNRGPKFRKNCAYLCRRSACVFSDDAAIIERSIVIDGRGRYPQITGD